MYVRLLDYLLVLNHSLHDLDEVASVGLYHWLALHKVFHNEVFLLNSVGLQSLLFILINVDGVSDIDDHFLLFLWYLVDYLSLIPLCNNACVVSVI